MSSTPAASNDGGSQSTTRRNCSSISNGVTCKANNNPSQRIKRVTSSPQAPDETSTSSAAASLAASAPSPAPPSLVGVASSASDLKKVAALVRLVAEERIEKKQLEERYRIIERELAYTKKLLENREEEKVVDPYCGSSCQVAGLGHASSVKIRSGNGIHTGEKAHDALKGNHLTSEEDEAGLERPSPSLSRHHRVQHDNRSVPPRRPTHPSSCSVGSSTSLSELSGSSCDVGRNDKDHCRDHGNGMRDNIAAERPTTSQICGDMVKVTLEMESSRDQRCNGSSHRRPSSNISETIEGNSPPKNEAFDGRPSGADLSELIHHSEVETKGGGAWNSTHKNFRPRQHRVKLNKQDKGVKRGGWCSSQRQPRPGLPSSSPDSQPQTALPHGEHGSSHRCRREIPSSNSFLCSSTRNMNTGVSKGDHRLVAHSLDTTALSFLVYRYRRHYKKRKRQVRKLEKLLHRERVQHELELKQIAGMIDEVSQEYERVQHRFLKQMASKDPLSPRPDNLQGHSYHAPLGSFGAAGEGNEKPLSIQDNLTDIPQSFSSTGRVPLQDAVNSMEVCGEGTKEVFPAGPREENRPTMNLSCVTFSPPQNGLFYVSTFSSPETVAAPPPSQPSFAPSSEDLSGVSPQWALHSTTPVKYPAAMPLGTSAPSMLHPGGFHSGLPPMPYFSSFPYPGWPSFYPTPLGPLPSTEKRRDGGEDTPTSASSEILAVPSPGAANISVPAELKTTLRPSHGGLSPKPSSECDAEPQTSSSGASSLRTTPGCSTKENSADGSGRDPSQRPSTLPPSSPRAAPPLNTGGSDKSAKKQQQQQQQQLKQHDRMKDNTLERHGKRVGHDCLDHPQAPSETNTTTIMKKKRMMTNAPLPPPLPPPPSLGLGAGTVPPWQWPSAFQPIGGVMPTNADGTLSHGFPPPPPLSLPLFSTYSYPFYSCAPYPMGFTPEGYTVRPSPAPLIPRHQSCPSCSGSGEGNGGLLHKDREATITTTIESETPVPIHSSHVPRESPTEAATLCNAAASQIKKIKADPNALDEDAEGDLDAIFNQHNEQLDHCLRELQRLAATHAVRRETA